MKRLVVVAAVLTTIAVYAQKQPPVQQVFTPTLIVSMGPYRGIIPASLANGRPVYQFSARVMDEEQNQMLASTQVLMQAGDTKTLTGRARPPQKLLAAVSLDERGQARYRVEYLRDGRRVLASNATIALIE